MRQKSTIKFFMQYLYPQKYRLFFAVLCGFFKFSVPVVTAIITGKTIEALNSNLSSEEKFDTVLHMICYGVVFLCISPLFTFGRNIFAIKAISEITNTLRNRLFKHIQKLSHSYFESKQSGYLTSRVMTDVLTIENFVDKVLIQSWMQIFLFTFVLTYFFIQNWMLGLLTVLMLPIQLYFLRKLSRKMNHISKKISEANACIAGFTMEHIANYHVIKCFSSEKDVVKKFCSNTSKLEDLKIGRGHLTAINQTISQLTNNLSPMVVVLAGSYLACFYPNFLTIGTLVTFVMLQSKVYDPLNFLSEMVVVIADAKTAIFRIQEIIETKPDVRDKVSSKNLENVRGEIKFDNVSFSYADNNPIIKNISFTIPAKSTVAFVGSSGGGKSTITKLLPRFYEAKGGKILIDNCDTSEIKLEELRNNIGFVPQEPMLFTGTIYENILFGNPNAKKKDVLKAASLAYANEFIEKLPMGFDTQVGERGVSLSGGQKQRIAIARAFLKNPSILVLDEATSALDNQSEALVQKSLNELMKNRTTIIIAHRLSTIRHANQIFVFEDGRLREHGTHGDLIDHKGKYFELSQKAG